MLDLFDIDQFVTDCLTSPFVSAIWAKEILLFAVRSVPLSVANPNSISTAEHYASSYVQPTEPYPLSIWLLCVHVLSESDCILEAGFRRFQEA